jgi:hypothetical protein
MWATNERKGREKVGKGKGRKGEKREGESASNFVKPAASDGMETSAYSPIIERVR